MKRWCDKCCRIQVVAEIESFISCGHCGKVLEEDNFVTGPTFVKDGGGHSRFDGNYVNTVASDLGTSFERTLDRAHDTICDIADNLGLTGGDKITLPAKRFYRMALEKDFTKGRRADQTAAACLYIVCRVEKKPFLLIEFSQFLRVDVYVLGAVFLQLCKVLQLVEHPAIMKPVDPSLFIHRFARGLLGETNHEVTNTALRILASMKRDWMQTGRKPSGVCGAALYISALSHGYKFKKADIVKVVHICEGTLTKRLIEFEGTESGGLTLEEFNHKAVELEQSFKSLEKCTDKDESVCQMSDSEESQSDYKDELLCEHRDKGNHDDLAATKKRIKPYAHGLCKECYLEFLTISGGIEGGSDPPAFQRGERESLDAEVHGETKRLDADQSDEFEIDNPGVPAEHEGVDEDIKSGEEKLDTFSDIEDAEVDGYLHNEEEKQYKKIIWEEMNKEYFAQLAEKAKADPAGEVKPKKERRPKRPAEDMNPKTAAEATHQALTKKRISSKVNYDKLKELLDEPELSGDARKTQTDNHMEKNELSGAEKSDSEIMNSKDEYDEWNSYADYQDNSYYDYDEEY